MDFPPEFTIVGSESNTAVERAKRPVPIWKRLLRAASGATLIAFAVFMTCVANTLYPFFPAQKPPPVHREGESYLTHWGGYVEMPDPFEGNSPTGRVRSGSRAGALRRTASEKNGRNMSLIHRLVVGHFDPYTAFTRAPLKSLDVVRTHLMLSKLADTQSRQPLAGSAAPANSSNCNWSFPACNPVAGCVCGLRSACG